MIPKTELIPILIKPFHSLQNLLFTLFFIIRSYYWNPNLWRIRQDKVCTDISPLASILSDLYSLKILFVMPARPGCITAKSRRFRFPGDNPRISVICYVTFLSMNLINGGCRGGTFICSGSQLAAISVFPVWYNIIIFGRDSPSLEFY